MPNLITEPNKYGILTESRLLDFKQKIGFALPADYRSFLLNNNGGMPENQFFDFYNEGNAMQEVSTIGCFFPLQYDAHRDSSKKRFVESLEDIQKTFYEESEEENHLPIACDMCGNPICLSLNPKSFGQIFFFDHDQEILSFISRNFTEFFEYLEKDSD